MDTETEIALIAAKDGVLIPVRAKPRGRANAIEGVRNGALLISVTAAPAEGAANAAILAVLAEALDCPKTLLELARGHKARDKQVRWPGISLSAARAKLDSVLARGKR